MNQAIRMERLGQVNKIHVSADTAELLTAAGKGPWLVPREDEVTVTGRGHVKSFWLKIADRAVSAVSSVSQSERSSKWKKLDEREKSKQVAKTERLVKWNVAELSKLVKNVVAARVAKDKAHHQQRTLTRTRSLNTNEVQQDHKIPLDSVLDIVYLPELDLGAVKCQVRAEDIDLGDNVMQQLRTYPS